MNEAVDISKLKEAIQAGEDEIARLEENNLPTGQNKHKRVTKALEKAYALLNKNNYLQKDVNKCEDIIWKALEDNNAYFVIWFFIFGFLLSGVTVFSVYEAYSFVQSNWDSNNNFTPTIDEETSQLITVNYIETNIMNLENLRAVSDEVGMQSTPLEFEITNDSTKVGDLNYLVNYTVNIVELNGGLDKVVDKKYIKYQFTTIDTDSKEVESSIGTLADLKQNTDGSYQLTSNSQAKDGFTGYKVRVWINAVAGNDQQGRSYIFAFKVNAAIAKI